MKKILEDLRHKFFPFFKIQQMFLSLLVVNVQCDQMCHLKSTFPLYILLTMNSFLKAADPLNVRQTFFPSTRAN